MMQLLVQLLLCVYVCVCVSLHAVYWLSANSLNIKTQRCNSQDHTHIQTYIRAHCALKGFLKKTCWPNVVVGDDRDGTHTYTSTLMCPPTSPLLLSILLLLLLLLPCVPTPHSTSPPTMFSFLLDSLREENSPYRAQPDVALYVCMCVHEDNPLPIGSTLTHFWCSWWLWGYFSNGSVSFSVLKVVSLKQRSSDYNMKHLKVAFHKIHYKLLTRS